MKAAEKIFFMVERSLEFINESDTKEHRREFLLYSSHLSKCFSLIFFAAFEDPDDVFYQNCINDDVKLMGNIMEIVEVDDIDTHYKNLMHGFDFFNYMISVIFKGLEYDRNLLQNLSMLSWAMIYKVWNEESLREGQLANNCMNYDMITKAVLYMQQDKIIHQLVDIPGRIEVDHEFYIQK